MILDIHSHKPVPYPKGIVSLRSFDLPLAEGQLYSAGIHPWDTDAPVTEATFAALDEIAANKQVVAVGECGVDVLKGAPMYRQLQIFRRQVELSESLKKPLIIHAVKSADIILGLKRDLQPRQQWVVHGFRGKPALARQLTDKGIMLSFGEHFNADTVAQMPQGMLLAETDDSILTITQIIESLSAAANRDLTPEIASTVEALLGSYS